MVPRLYLMLTLYYCHEITLSRHHNFSCSSTWLHDRVSLKTYFLSPPLKKKRFINPGGLHYELRSVAKRKDSEKWAPIYLKTKATVVAYQMFQKKKTISNTHAQDKK